MLEAEAKKIAIDFVSSQKSAYYSLHFVSINESAVNPRNWAAAFEVRPSNGGVLEGPVFVIVDGIDGSVKFFNS